jgi:hypothetical protein
VNPLIRFALAHAKQAPLYHLEGIGFQVDQHEEQPIFGCRQGAVLRGYPETLQQRRVCIKQLPCGNEMQGNRFEKACSA